MPDPSMEEATTWMGRILGAGGVALLAKILFHRAKDEHRLKTVEDQIADHELRLEEGTQDIKVLLDRGDRAIADRAEILNMLAEIRGRL